MFVSTSAHGVESTMSAAAAASPARLRSPPPIPSPGFPSTESPTMPFVVPFGCATTATNGSSPGSSIGRTPSRTFCSCLLTVEPSSQSGDPERVCTWFRTAPPANRNDGYGTLFWRTVRSRMPSVAFSAVSGTTGQYCWRSSATADQS